MPLGAARITFLAKSSVTAVAEVIRRKVGVTAVGNAQVDTAQSQYGGSSLLLDGTGDALITGLDMADTSGEFTYEGWVRFASLGVNQVAMSFNGGSSNFESGESFIQYNSGSNGIRAYFGGQTTGYTSISVDTWYHVAVTRNSSNLVTFWLDGVDSGNFTNADTIPADRFFQISGYTTSITQPLNGHVDEVRVSNICRYTSNFTPSTTPFVNDANTLVLLHMDGTDGGIDFVDDNGVRAKIGVSGQQATLTNIGSKFGTTSYLSGYSGSRGSGRRLKVQNKEHWTLDGDFTVECWVWVDEDFGSTTTYIWAHREYTGGPGLGLACNASPNTFLLSDVAATGEDITSSTWNLDQWYHIATTRSGSTLELFVDGVSQGTSTYTYQHVENITIGNLEYATVLGFPGLIDEFRVSDNVRYTSNFTPQTQPFVNDANTLLLLHMDGTDGGIDFADDNGVRARVGVSAVGDAQIDTAESQFGGSSLLLDGTGDYLFVNLEPNTSLNFADDLTVEMWVRLQNTTQTWHMFAAGNDAEYFGMKNVGGGVYNLNTAISNGLNDFFYNLVIPTTPSADTWYHVAMVKDSSGVKAFFNGDELTTVNNSSGSFSADKGWNDVSFIGRYVSNLNANGHIDEVRVSNTARYTTDFTPSTTPFQNDDNTLLLLHMDGTDGSTTFIDDNGVTPNYDYGA